jgi:hypothetical protein
LDNSFSLYLEQLEVIAFFSGYSLLFVLINFLGSTLQTKKLFTQKAVSFLPIAYAFTGLLFIGFQLKKLSPYFSITHIQQTFNGHYLLYWGLLSVLFFIPALYKKPAFSFLHSLVFFCFIIKDIFLASFQTTDRLILKNTMNLYTESLLLNSASFAFILFCAFLIISLKKRHNR